MRALLSPKPSRHGFGLQRRRLSPTTTKGFVIALAGARLFQRSCFPRLLWRHHLHLAGGLQFGLFRSSMSSATRSGANRNGGTAPLLSSVLISAGGGGCAVWGWMKESRPMAGWVLWRFRLSNLLAWAASSSTKFGLFVFGFVWVLGLDQVLNATKEAEHDRESQGPRKKIEEDDDRVRSLDTDPVLFDLEYSF